MKKNAFFALICLLFAATGQAQNMVEITGFVTKLSNGAPVGNHPIFYSAGDSLNPVFGDVATIQDGSYSIELNLPPGISEVALSTFTNCDPSGGFVTSVVNVMNGQSVVNFQVCDDSFPPLFGCFADISLLPVDTLEFQFNGYYYSLSDSLATAVSYLWDFGDGNTSTDPNPTHIYAADGVYTVTLTVTGTDGCVATALITFSTDFTGFPDCMGYILYAQTDTLTFDFDSQIYDPNGNLIQALSYNWDFGDGNTSTDASPTHTYAAQGVYNVQLHAITDQGCEIHSCNVVFAFDGPPVDSFWYGCQAMFYVGYGDSINNPTWPPLDPLTLSFYDNSLGVAQSWLWDFGDGSTSTLQNPTHTYADSGIYLVTLSIETVNGCESQATYEICVGNNCWGIPEFDCQAMFIPLIDSLGGNGIQFIDLSYSLDSLVAWSWNFGDGTTSNEQNPYHVYAQPGIYTVTLTIEGFLCNSQISFEIDTENPWNFNSNGNPAKLGLSPGSVSTKEQFALEGIKLFPNPAQTDLSIAFSSQKAIEYELRISDLRGTVLNSSVLQANTGLNAAHLNISALPSGLYLAEIRSGDTLRSLKFVKQ